MIDLAEFRHFKYLLAIAEHKGFRAAAEHLNTSQPSLSKQARDFQETFGIRLFLKTRSGRIRLTPAGQAMVPIARGLLEARVEAINVLRELQQGSTRPLTLGCSHFVDRNLFRDTCDLYQQISGRTQFRRVYCDTQQLVDELIQGTVGVAIATLPIQEQRVSVNQLLSTKLVLCMRRDDELASRPSLMATDLVDRLRVVRNPDQHSLAHERLLQLLRDAGVSLADYSVASHPNEMIEMVREGHGTALIPDNFPLPSDLTTRVIGGVDWTVDTAFVTRQGDDNPFIPVLYRMLKQKLSSENKKQDRTPKQRPLALKQTAISPLRNAS